MYVLCWIQSCCYVTGLLLRLDVQVSRGSLSLYLSVPAIRYIFDLQVHVVNGQIRYMARCVRMGLCVSIRYSNVGVYLLRENSLVSVSGQNDCISCFGIDLRFGTRISGSN